MVTIRYCNGDGTKRLGDFAPLPTLILLYLARKGAAGSAPHAVGVLRSPFTPVRPHTAALAMESSTAYLARHDLEKKIATAVTAVLKARPADPLLFIGMWPRFSKHCVHAADWF